jgi:hypothetical protein
MCRHAALEGLRSREQQALTVPARRVWKDQPFPAAWSPPWAAVRLRATEKDLRSGYALAMPMHDVTACMGACQITRSALPRGALGHSSN